MLNGLEKYGFNHIQVSQLEGICKKENISKEDMQNSIDYFYYDLEHNDVSSRTTTNIVNYFMGIIRNYKYYNVPDNYKTPDEARKEYAEKQTKLERREAYNKLRMMRQIFATGKTMPEKERFISDNNYTEMVEGIENLDQKLWFIFERFFEDDIRANLGLPSLQEELDAI